MIDNEKDDLIQSHLRLIKGLREIQRQASFRPGGWLYRDMAKDLLNQPCPICKQSPNGQSGEYSCPACGLPLLHDDEEIKE